MRGKRGSDGDEARPQGRAHLLHRGFPVRSYLESQVHVPFPEKAKGLAQLAEASVLASDHRPSLLVAPLLWMQRFLPLLAASGSGSIVNVSSITAAMSPTGTGLYPPSKAALEAMTRMAAVEFGPQGVRCNAVGPGIIPTEGTLAHYGDEETRARRGRTLPAQRYGQPEDVADVVSFFC